MSPERLFDYLEGTLPDEERIEIERQLAIDPQLPRQLAIAREMHRRSGGSREVIGVSQDNDIPVPNGKLGRRIATAFALLVFVNVLVGLAFIVGHKKSTPTDLGAKELALRQQLTASLQRTAESALPMPTLTTDEIHLVASASERDGLADNVVMLASQHGGTATKAPPDEGGITVLADLPTARADDFRQALAPLAQANFSSPTPRSGSPAANERINIYVRISQATPSPGP